MCGLAASRFRTRLKRIFQLGKQKIQITRLLNLMKKITTLIDISLLPMHINQKSGLLLVT